MTVLAILPARFGSTRFPGKPLTPIAGKPMIQHVWERTRLAKQIDAGLIVQNGKMFGGIDVVACQHVGVRQVPFTGHRSVIAVASKDLSNGRPILRHRSAVAAQSDFMWILSGQQRGPRWATT